MFKEEWVYCQIFFRELLPQRGSFCALGIQLWCLSVAAAVAGGDLLHHEVPPWSIMHPAGLLQGIQALTFFLSRGISKDCASLLMWKRRSSRWGEMLPGWCCFSIQTSRRAWDTPLSCSCPWKAEMFLNMSFPYLGEVKAIWHWLWSSKSNNTFLHSLIVFSQTHFLYWCTESCFLCGTSTCFLVCAEVTATELCYFLGAAQARN